METKKKWELDMDESMCSLMQNQTYDLVKLLLGNKTLHKKQVYKVKEEVGGKKWYKVKYMATTEARKEVIWL